MSETPEGTLQIPQEPFTIPHQNSDEDRTDSEKKAQETNIRNETPFFSMPANVAQNQIVQTPQPSPAANSPYFAIPPSQSQPFNKLTPLNTEQDEKTEFGANEGKQNTTHLQDLLKQPQFASLPVLPKRNSPLFALYGCTHNIPLEQKVIEPVEEPLQGKEKKKADKKKSKDIPRYSQYASLSPNVDLELKTGNGVMPHTTLIHAYKKILCPEFFTQRLIVSDTFDIVIPDWEPIGTVFGEERKEEVEQKEKEINQTEQQQQQQSPYISDLIPDKRDLDLWGEGLKYLSGGIITPNANTEVSQQSSSSSSSSSDIPIPHQQLIPSAHRFRRFVTFIARVKIIGGSRRNVKCRETHVLTVFSPQYMVLDTRMDTFEAPLCERYCTMSRFRFIEENMTNNGPQLKEDEDIWNRDIPVQVRIDVSFQTVMLKSFIFRAILVAISNGKGKAGQKELVGHMERAGLAGDGEEVDAGTGFGEDGNSIAVDSKLSFVFGKEDKKEKEELKDESKEKKQNQKDKSKVPEKKVGPRRVEYYQIPPGPMILTKESLLNQLSHRKD